MRESEPSIVSPTARARVLVHAVRGVARARATIPLLLVALLVWEGFVLLLQARQKPLWYDELVTFHVSALQPLSALWEALKDGVDGLPFGYYVLVEVGRMLPGPPEVTLRATSIAGYLLALLGVYWIVNRRMPAAAGLAAALLLSLTPFRAYALEARPYSLMVGLLAVSVVLWQRLDRHRLITPLLAASLALAVSSHHYAVAAFAAFGSAEVAAAVMLRRIRWRAWLALLAGSLPFLPTLPVLLGFRDAYGGMFWSRPAWEQAAWTYGTYMGLPITGGLAVAAFVGLALAWSALRIGGHEGVEASRQAPSPPEGVLLIGFLLYPALLVTVAKLLGGGYTPRYGWPAVLAIVVGITTVGWSNARIRRCLLAALLVTFAYQARVEVREVSAGSEHPGERWAWWERLSPDQQGLPLVIASPITYLEAARYAPPPMRERVVGIADPAKQGRVFGTDTPDRANRLLARIAPLQVEAPDPFEAAHPRFLVYSGGDFDWFTPYLVGRSYRIRLLATDRARALYIVER